MAGSSVRSASQHLQCLYPRIYGCASLAADEALSSWIMLVAVAKRWSIKEVLKSWNYRVASAYAADISSHIPPLSTMASTTFESGIRLAEAHWAGATILSDQRFSCLSNHSDGLPIHLFCPACLAEDGKPFLRKRWRLAYQFVCEHHNQLLHDCCPQCRRRIDYSRFHEHRPRTCVAMFFRDCPHCRFDLTQTFGITSQVEVFGLLLEAQQLFHRLVTSPFYKHPTAGTVSSAKILQSLLIPHDDSYPAGSQLSQYSAINFRRLFLNRYDDVMSLLLQTRRLEFRTQLGGTGKNVGRTSNHGRY